MGKSLCDKDVYARMPVIAIIAVAKKTIKNAPATADVLTAKITKYILTKTRYKSTLWQDQEKRIKSL